MLIYSTGLANCVQYVLNKQNQDEIIAHQIDLKKMISRINHFGKITLNEIIWSYQFTNSITGITYKGKIDINAHDSNFIDPFLKNIDNIIKFYRFDNNPYYKKSYSPTKYEIAAYVDIWKTQNINYIEAVLNEERSCDYNTILKFINIYHELNWCKNFVAEGSYIPTSINSEILDVILDIYDVMLLETTVPYDYEKYLRCKELRPFFKEEFKLYDVDRLIHILPIISPDISPFKTIERYSIPYRLNYPENEKYKFCDSIYSSRYYKFINYYLRCTYFRAALVKPQLHQLFEPSQNIKEVDINELYLLTDFLNNCRINNTPVEYIDDIYTAHTKWSELEFQLLDKYLIINNNKAHINYNDQIYYLYSNRRHQFPTLAFGTLPDTTIDTIEIEYYIYEGSKCYKYEDNYYNEYGKVDANKLVNMESINVDVYSINGQNVIGIYTLDVAIIYDDYKRYYRAEFEPGKKIKHYYGVPIIEHTEHVLLHCKPETKTETKTYTCTQIDWVEPFNYINQTFISAFDNYFIDLTQRILLFRIGKFELDFYGTDETYNEKPIYKSACYISTSYMTSATSKAPFQSEYDYPKRQNIYIIIANHGISVCHLHLNSISKENEILINKDIKCIKHNRKYMQSYDREIDFIELIP